MELRFIEYNSQIFVVIGFSYITKYDPPECYVAIPVKGSIIKSTFQVETINIPFTKATEITNPKTIKALLVLYGR